MQPPLRWDSSRSPWPYRCPALPTQPRDRSGWMSKFFPARDNEFGTSLMLSAARPAGGTRPRRPAVPPLPPLLPASAGGRACAAPWWPPAALRGCVWLCRRLLADRAVRRCCACAVAQEGSLQAGPVNPTCGSRKRDVLPGPHPAGSWTDGQRQGAWRWLDGWRERRIETDSDRRREGGIHTDGVMDRENTYTDTNV